MGATLKVYWCQPELLTMRDGMGAFWQEPVRVGLLGRAGPSVQFSSVQSLSHVQLFATPWTEVPVHHQLLEFTQTHESVMPSNYLILCCPLLLLPSVIPSIRVFSNESALRMRWPKYWSFSFSISPSNEYSGLISFRMDWLDLFAVQGTLWVP